MSYKYFIVNNIVFDNEYLTIKEDYLLLMLYKYRDTKTNIASPKEDFLLRMLDCSKRTLRRYTKTLEKYELVDKQTRRGKDNKYKLLNVSSGGFTIIPSSLVATHENFLYQDMVYSHLCRLAGKSNSAWVSLDRLAARVKCGMENLLSAINNLEDCMWIKKTKKGGCNFYRVEKGDTS